jgi:phosphoglycerol transferase MdoB-like AlkP superfamily enzyme
MKLTNESYFTIALMAVSFFAGVYAFMHWDFKTALVPVLCGGVIFILCLFQFIRELKGSETKSSQIMDSGFDKDKSTERENIAGAIKYFGILGGLYLSIYIIGLYTSIGLFVFLYLLASREVSAAKSKVFAAGIVGVVYIIINEVAEEALPDPLLYKLLF